MPLLNLTFYHIIQFIGLSKMDKYTNFSYHLDSNINWIIEREDKKKKKKEKEREEKRA